MFITWNENLECEGNTSECNEYSNRYPATSYKVYRSWYQETVPHIIGLDLYSTLEEHNSWNALSEDCELVVMFGGMPLKNSKVSSGGVGKHTTELGMKKCLNNGTCFINISPLKNDSPDFL